MNSKPINNEIILLSFSFLIGVSLLFKDQLSTIAIVLFIACLTLVGFVKNSGLSNRIIFFTPALLLLLRLVGLFSGDENLALKELVRSLPLLIICIPLFLFSTSLEEQVDKIESCFFYGILTGLLIFMITCNFTVIYEMISKNEPLEYLFRWRHMNINFAEPIGTHPPYVGIITIYALIKTLYHKVFSKYLKVIIVVLIFFLLIQLLARNALVAFFLITLHYIFSKFDFKVLILTVLLLGTLAIIVIYHPHPYLKKKLFDRFNFTESKSFDKRLERVKASYNVFKTSPVIGVGPGKDSRLRNAQYKKLGFTTAYENNFNSHNQFVEYLVSYGLIGLSIFLCVLYLLWSFSKGINSLNKLLIIAFIFSCLTESVLERSLGIKYFSMISFFILLRFSSQDKRNFSP